MPFRKNNVEDETRRQGAGERRAVDGFTGVALHALRHADVVYAEPGLAAAGFDVEVTGQQAEKSAAARLQVPVDAADLGGRALGAGAAGLRVAAFTHGQALVTLRASLTASARQQVPFLIHHLCTTDHDAYVAAAGTGAFQLFAANVQEAVDLALIARFAAEQSLTPGVVAMDAMRTAASVQTADVLDGKDAAAFVGASTEEIASMTPAQELVFGARRRRVPVAFDLDRPAGMGAALDHDVSLQSGAAHDVFFAAHVAAALDGAMNAFAERTGRMYARATGYRLDDAEYVVLAQGALVVDLRAVVDHLRQEKGIRAGLINLITFRPFPGDLLSHFLQGRKGVTVLTHSTGSAPESQTLLNDLRATFDRAAENGATAPERPAHEGYAAYGASGDRPRLFVGTYASDAAAPSFEALCGVFYNMMSNGAAKSHFTLGVRFALEEPRLPALERMQQLMRRAYPALKERALHVRRVDTPASQPCSAFQIRTTAAWDGRAAAKLLAASVFDGLGWQVATRPEASVQPHDPHVVTVRHAPEARSMQAPCRQVGALIVSHAAMLRQEATRAALTPGGVVVLASSDTPETLWRRLPASVRSWVTANDVQLCVVDAEDLAKAAAPDERFAPALRTQALVGAFVAVYDGFDAEGRRRISEAYRQMLATSLAGVPALATAVAGVLDAAGAVVQTINWSGLTVDDETVPEAEAPWTVREAPVDGPQLNNPARFWRSVGYLYETGRQNEVLADPFLASGAVPARSSAGHGVADAGGAVPQLLAEKCTGCGACWALCPDAALPATIQDVGTLAETAVARSEAAGNDVFQLKRVLPHVVKQANKLVAGDDLDRYLRLGDLLQVAFEQVVEKMGLDQQKRADLEASFEAVRQGVDTFPIARTEPFYHGRERRKKGEGLLLSIAVDAEACKACGLCVAACPEGAMEMVPQAPATIASGREHRAFMRALPEVSLEQIEELVREDDDATQVYHLLNRSVYQTVIGSHDGAPGDGVRTALHLVLAAAETLMQPRVQALTAQMRSLVDGLEQQIRGCLAEAVAVNDLDTLSRRLSSLGSGTLALDDLATLFGDEADTHAIDQNRLVRLTVARDRLKDLLGRYEQAGHGDGRARMALAIGARDVSAARTAFPHNPYPFPWIFHLPDDAASVAEGLHEGLKARMLEAFRTLRLARLLVDGLYDAREHEGALKGLTWEDLTLEEEAVCPPLIAVVDRTGPALGRLLRTSLPIKVVCLDALRYADAAGSPGRTLQDEPGLWGVVQQRAFVMQGAIGYPGHLFRGLLDGLACRGPALFNLLATEPGGGGYAPDETADQARRAVDSRAFPTFIFDPSVAGELSDRLRLDGNPDVDADWARQRATLVSPTGRLVDAEWPLTFADWAVRQGRFTHLFRWVPKKDWHDEMLPVATYLTLTEDERGVKEPYVQLSNDDGRSSRWVPSQAMVRETEARLAFWNLLRELAGVRSHLAERYAAEADARADERVDVMRTSLEASFQAQAAEMEATQAQRYHQRLKEQLLALSGFGAEGARSALREFLNPSGPQEPNGSSC